MTITAPATEPPLRTRTRVRVQPRAPQRPAPSEAPPPPARTAPPADRGSRGRSAASQRAYARKEQRRAGHALVSRGAPARRAPFVLLIMALLTVGLIASLWLSTAAAADSYRLEQARLQARELSERSEQLRQEVASLQTAPELARRARDLGMVPTGEPAHLVVRPDGTVLVVGKPAPATVPPAGQQPAEGQPPAGQQPAPDPAHRPGGAG